MQVDGDTCGQLRGWHRFSHDDCSCWPVMRAEPVRLPACGLSSAYLDTTSDDLPTPMSLRTIFLAHAEADHEFASRLTEFLEFGCNIACDTDGGLVLPGEDLIARAERSPRGRSICGRDAPR